MTYSPPSEANRGTLTCPRSLKFAPQTRQDNPEVLGDLL